MNDIADIAEIYHRMPTTVQIAGRSYYEKELAATLARKNRVTPPIPAKVTGDIEAQIIAFTCRSPPKCHIK